MSLLNGSQSGRQEPSGGTEGYCPGDVKDNLKITKEKFWKRIQYFFNYKSIPL